MSLNSYDKGTVVRVSGAFADITGAAVDPSTVAFKFSSPASSAITTYTYGVDAALKKASTGNFYVDIAASVAGAWSYRWESTGTAQAAFDGEFLVADSALA